MAQRISNGPGILRLTSYAEAIHRKEGPPHALQDLACRSEFLKELFEFVYTLGWAIPSSVILPDVGNVRSVFTEVIEVPPATTKPDPAKGTILVPGDAKAIKISAPMHQALVVDVLRLLPLNRTAAEDGFVSFKRMQVMGFSDGWCHAGEPSNGRDDRGVFQNVDRIILCKKGCFDLHAKNKNQCSTAKFLVHAEMWSAC